jgi:sortase A
MKLSRNLLLQALFVTTLGGAAIVVGVIMVRAALPVPIPATAATPAPAKLNPQIKFAPAPIVLQPHLIISRIKVDTPIDPMGLTADGAMEAPNSSQNVGWFKLGAHPGDKGTAVIAGHYGRWKDGKESVFDGLHTLQKGDNVSVKDEKGTVTTFVVRALRTYSQDQIAPEVFGSSDKIAHLNLITCEGTWNGAQQSYSNRLVVFTDKKT